MDLHRTAFKMENSSYLPNPLASPALMVLASTAEASRDASISCQQPRPFGVPVSVDKDVHIPFTNGSYTFASMYHRQGGVPGAFPNRDFPPQLLHLHPQFAPPNLDCTPISMLNHSGVGAFRPFASAEDRDSYQSAFTPAKRLKNCHETESPHLRFSDSEGKEYEFTAQLPSSSPSSLKLDDSGKKVFAVSGLISDRENSASPEESRNERCKKKATLYDTQAPICPICQVLLRPSELQDHMEQELEKLTQSNLCKHSMLKDSTLQGTVKPLSTTADLHNTLSSSTERRKGGREQSVLLSAPIKREGESPTASPLSADDTHHSDRYQTFLRVRSNRQARLNARIGKNKRKKASEDGQVCPLCNETLSGSMEEMSRHVEACLDKRDGSYTNDDESVDIENESASGNRFEEYEWCGQKRIRATTLLEGGFRGSGFVTCSSKENHDSDADLDVDGDDTLEYGKPQYTEADIIPCTGEEPGEAKEREALRGAVLNGGTPSNRITPEFSKWASDEMPSTSNGESGKLEMQTQKTCKNSEIEKISEDATVTTIEALKARIRELERQLSRGDRYKCLICMDSYSMPLTSIQCWHVHCEECWLRTLGAKKLCPQCNTITSPGDLRRVYL
ncbi:E3 ubiquitin-protein ligase RNF220a isoform X1 [Hemitrygon akajei]|uniref:E3 ubiquitin-protein ligase RNF220a isoform X1 n=1 Tax=Hypanus sabinus TaxID=79690 RepID=UPI0028C501AA|nr:E3 ubiquitin-protein ligase RNF220a isoform X1 [Hypanus sabinus]